MIYVSVYFSGVNFLIRKMACSASPELEVVQNQNEMKISLISMVKTKHEEFTVGEEFEEKQHDGLMYKVSLWTTSSCESLDHKLL